MIDKLKSKSGVTIISALVALIVCVMISAVIVYTAYSNLGRIKVSREREQTYLTISSAARLVKASLTEDRIEFTRTTTHSIQNGSIISTDVDDDVVYIDSEKTSILAEKINDWVEERGVSYSETIKQTNLELKNIGEISELPDASAEVSMRFMSSGNSYLIVDLMLEAQQAGGDSYSKIKLTFPMTVVSPPDQTIVDNESQKTIKTVRNYYINEPEVTKG